MSREENCRNNKLEFVSMCDILPEAMDEKAAKFGLEDIKKYTDYKEMHGNTWIDSLYTELIEWPVVENQEELET